MGSVHRPVEALRSSSNAMHLVVLSEFLLVLRKLFGRARLAAGFPCVGLPSSLPLKYFLKVWKYCKPCRRLTTTLIVSLLKRNGVTLLPEVTEAHVTLLFVCCYALTGH